MSLFARSYNRFAGHSNSTSTSNSISDPPLPNDHNITYRKKLSAVSTSLQGLVAASPRNCYSRNAAVPSSLRRQQRVADEVDGVGMSTEKTPVELRAAEIRRMNSKKEEKVSRTETHHTPPPPPPQIEAQPTSTAVNQKKSRTSTTSLASVFRSRASSPIERMRKFIGRSRSTSKQPKEAVVQELPSPSKSAENEKLLLDELEKTKIQLSNARYQLEKYKEKENVPKSDSSVQHDTLPVVHVATMTASEEALVIPKEEKTVDNSRIRQLEREVAELRKECVEKTEDFHQTRKDFVLILEEAVVRKDEAERRLEEYKKSIVGQDGSITSSEESQTNPEVKKITDKENLNPDAKTPLEDRVRQLEEEVAELQKECDEKTEEFRRTREDFLLILKEAVNRKNDAERKLDGITRSVADEDDWMTLMVQHRHTLRRNVLLMWAQKKLEPYSNELSVSNFSSDWTDCRAFCAILADLFPDLVADSPSPIDGDCVSRCRRAFKALEIPFDEHALGISPSPTDSGAEDSSCSSINGLTNWRIVMNTVFLIYKRGELGK